MKLILKPFYFLILLVFTSPALLAQQQIINSQPVLSQALITQATSDIPAEDSQQNQTKQTLGPLDVISLIGSPEHLTGIQLIENRFRIDHYVDEIVMVFFRKYGSAPVILIRPDGSKLYAPTIDESEGQWYDDLTYDMVRLKNPMVGPWQVVGRIDSNSKIMVLSDIQLQAQPFPELMFSGEIIKLTASLLNAGKPVEYADFSDVVSLDVTFASTNNNEYENFAADAVKVAQFKDDGQGFDKKRKDSIFTGEFRLNIASGEWLPSLFLDLGLFNRELTLNPVVLQPNPFDLQIESALEDNQLHNLKITPNTDLIDFSTFAFSGEVFYPTGESQRFAISEDSEPEKHFMLFNYGAGTYKIKLSAFGKDINGRDLMIHVPEFTFNIAPIVVEPEPIVDLEAQLAQQNMQSLPEAEPEPEMSAGQITLIVVLGNLTVFILAFVFIKFGFMAKTPFWKKISFNKLKFKSKKKADKTTPAEEKNTEVNDFSSETDDIIDLTLPEET
ncbi:TIGR03503 family protein [Catenovulum sp. 2E275]|uniref:TIGR03503 family protein n=1 Tax=Catenovulum sp. 2E275 TaxID=2980497 RepID=UPI0021CF0738|nr:TIGR03503 family protein [Catenovulum sp. 2E275]MCU4674850.1 TIGR03503 family protein [Catenovulum sp. 2E275]